jgi:OOP family OmpA-OmpF porin
MKHKGLYFLIAMALGGVGAAHAQDTAAPADSASTSSSMSSYDDRWYIAPTVGGYYNDTKRNTNSRQFYYGLGFGRFFSPNMSIDAFIDRTKRTRDNGPGVGGLSSQSWASTNIGVAARFYYGVWNAWRPYLLAGVLGSHHQNSSNNGWAPAAELGVGVSKTVSDSSDIRLETGYRYDWDNKTNVAKSGYGDIFLGFSIVSRFGAPAAAPVPEAAPVAAPAAPDCSKTVVNGVNLCDNKCPNLPEGTIVGPDGCPQKVVIDLRGRRVRRTSPRRLLNRRRIPLPCCSRPLIPCSAIRRFTSRSLVTPTRSAAMRTT